MAKYATIELEGQAVSLVASMKEYIAQAPVEDRADLGVAARKLRDAHREKWLASLDQVSLLTERESKELLEVEQALEPEQRSPIDKIVLVFKLTRLCNLRCTYCNSWAEGLGQVMSFSSMARLVRRSLLSPGVTQVDFVLHGGEATLLDPKIVRKMIWLQERYRKPGQVVTNAIQTNGYSISDQWIGLFAAADMGVGVSIDGPPEVHDARRLTADGEGSYADVARTMARLRRAGISFGVLIVADARITSYPVRQILGHFSAEGIRDIDFLNVVPGNNAMLRGESDEGYVPFEGFAEWLREVYSVWRTEFRDRISIRFLDDLREAVRSRAPANNCYFSGNCTSRIFTVEPGGKCGPCDKYVGVGGASFGVLGDQGLGELVSRANLVMDRAGLSVDFKSMERCRWFDLCRGSCPHDRLASTKLNPSIDSACCGLSTLLDDIEQHERGAAQPAPTEAPSRIGRVRAVN